MHTYATDAKDRESIPLWLAALAVAATLFLNYLLKALNLQIPWWVEAPSVMGFYGLLHGFFDNFLWRVQFKAIRLSEIPDIRGTWVGTVNSSYAGGTEIRGIILHVRQTWSKLSVKIETETSRSFSTMAVVNTSNSSEPGLKYEYINEPGTFSVQTMQTHRGTANLRLTPDGATLKGEYYTGRGRQSMGDMVFHKISTQFLTRETALKQANHSS
jgi:SMODS-associating 2TM, beta-strand rich effector domain